MAPLAPPLLALLQLFFALSWTVYVLFLPQLAESAGLGKGAVLWLLLLDQAIFAVMDWALGAHADRVAERIQRLGPLIAALTALSTVAFLALPFTALAGNGPLLITAVVVWSVTASVLRAPPLVLLARATDLSSRPLLAAWFWFGLGLAAALAPYTTLMLRGIDPRLPFALAGVAVLVCTLALVRTTQSATPASVQQARPAVDGRMLAFLAAALLLGVGFQIHYALNAAPRYLALVPAAQLPWLMPVFWIGFNLAIFPVSLILRKVSEARCVAAGAVAGSLGAGLASFASDLGILIAADLIAGVGWAAAMLGVLGAAMRWGASGREGFLAGGAFALFAVAVFARLGFTVSGIELDADDRTLLQWIAVLAWAGAAILLVRADGARPAALVSH